MSNIEMQEIESVNKEEHVFISLFLHWNNLTKSIKIYFSPTPPVNYKSIIDTEKIFFSVQKYIPCAKKGFLVWIFLISSSFPYSMWYF